MQSDKNLSIVVVLYLFSLFVLVIAKMIEDISIIDVGYLFVLLCSAVKLFLIVREERK